MKGKSVKTTMEVDVRGRTFMVEFANPEGHTVSPREFDAALEEVIRMGDDVGAQNLKGQSQNALKKTFSFHEITTPEAMDHYVASNLLASFMGNLDSLSGLNSSEKLTQQFGEIYGQVRDKQLTPEEGARQMNDLLTQARNNQRKGQQQQFFDVAERWINTPNIHPSEAIHGAVFDAYHLGCPDLPRIMAQQEYGAIYDAKYTSNIQARSMRAAKELFK